MGRIRRGWNRLGVKGIEEGKRRKSLEEDGGIKFGELGFLKKEDPTPGRPPGRPEQTRANSVSVGRPVGQPASGKIFFFVMIGYSGRPPDRPVI